MAVAARAGNKQRHGHAGAYSDESTTGDEDGEGEDEGAEEEGGGEQDNVEEERDEWVEVGSVKANEGPVWRAAWAPREYGTTLLVSIAGSVVNVWGWSRVPQRRTSVSHRVVSSKGTDRF